MRGALAILHSAILHPKPAAMLISSAKDVAYLSAVHS
jgi:hypothetical protein